MSRASCKGGLRGAQVRLRFALSVEARVEIALGHRPGVPKPLATFELAPRKDEARLGGENLGLGTLDLGGVFGGIDRDEQVALLHERALAEVHRVHGSGNAGAHLHPFDGFEAARELVPEDRVARLDDSHRNGNSLRGAVRRSVGAGSLSDSG